MPMHRENPAGLHGVQRAAHLHADRGVPAGGGVVVSLVIENSRFGLALLAIRQNELAAEAAGINARLWKMRSLVVSGMMAAVAGGFYARVLLVVTPDSVFGMLVSAQAVVVTLFGGVASVWGPVIGAAILVPLAETLQAELGTYCPASRAWCTASPSSRSCCCRPTGSSGPSATAGSSEGAPRRLGGDRRGAGRGGQIRRVVARAGTSPGSFRRRCAERPTGPRESRRAAQAKRPTR